jgi:hypothetical protein
MDPQANLDEQIALAQSLTDSEQTCGCGAGAHIDTGDAVRLAELVLALNDWLASGGFAPERRKGD